jgi:hypothetical protein
MANSDDKSIFYWAVKLINQKIRRHFKLVLENVIGTQNVPAGSPVDF